MVINIKGKIDTRTLQIALRVLQAGELIAGPTDTLYGILGDALQPEVVARIFRLKRRATGAPLPLICADVAQARKMVRMEALAQRLAQHFWPGPLTLALPAQPGIPAHLLAADGTLAVRVPAHELCRRLAKALGRPLTATSANLSGFPPPRQVEEISDEIRQAVSLIFDEGKLAHSKPSTIVKITPQEIKLVREGVIQASEIAGILGEPILEKK